MLSMHIISSDISIDIQAAIDTFARMHLRQMRMVGDQDQQYEESVAQ